MAAVAAARAAFVLSLVAAVVAGCAGEIETRKLSTKNMNDTEHWISGVIVYQPALFVEISAKTTLVQNGRLKGSSADNPPACVPVQSEKTVALPDLKNPYQIKYEPGLFDSNTFGVTLQTGVLSAVNGHVAGALNGATAAASGAGAGGALASLPTIPTPLGIPLSAPEEAPSPGLAVPSIERIQLHSNLQACNDGPVILGYRRVPLP